MKKTKAKIPQNKIFEGKPIKEKGITLISLIVTIIILVILAIVTIYNIIDHGIVQSAIIAMQKYDEQGARELLETKLVEIGACKVTDKENYNENEYIDKKIEQAGMKISGNVVTVGKYNFEIDRSILAIVGDAEKPVQKEYIKDKIIARYDGIQNTREGHKNDVTVWEDISGNNRDLIMQNSGLTDNIYWEEDGLVNSMPGTMGLKTELIPELQTLKSETVEIVIDFTADGTEMTRDIFYTIGAGYDPWVGVGFDFGINHNLGWGVKDEQSIVSFLTLEKNTKTYLAITVEEYQNGQGKARLYVNGKEVSSANRNSENFKIQDENANYIGMFNFCPGLVADNSFVGKIYSARVYGSALSKEEIENNYELDKERFKIGEKQNIISETLQYTTESLILHYDGIQNTKEGHDSNTTTWEDLSGNRNNGILNGCTWNENSLMLDDTKYDGVKLENKMIDLFKKSNTIELTMNFTGSNSRDILIGNYSRTGNINYENYSKKLRVYGIAGNYSDAVLENNKIQTLTFVMKKEENTIDVYKDKEKVTSVTSSNIGNYKSNWVDVWIGRDQRNGTTCLDGYIYSVRIYDKALSEEEINKNYDIDRARFGI